MKNVCYNLFQSYADEDHSLSSVRPHLFHTLEHFIDDCLKKS